MKLKWVVWEIQKDGDRRILLKTGPGQPTQSALTVSEACRILHLSRRQVYRLMKEGDLNPLGKFLGEWLLDREAVHRLASNPAHPHKLPGGFGLFFPEYSVRDLNPGTDRILVLSRLLDHGGQKEIQWLFRRYKKRDILEFLRSDGARLLSAKALNFWSLFFNEKTPELPAWRRRDWKQGGLI